MKAKERAKARELRAQGKSLAEISSALGVSKSSASLWCRDIELTDAQKMSLHSRWNVWVGAEANRESAKRGRQKFREAGFKRAKEDERFRLVCAIYWGEGQRCNRNVFSVSNSDPSMLKLIGSWLVEEGYSERLSFRVQYYGENGLSESEIREKWLEWLDFLGEQHLRKFTRCSLNRASQKKKTGRLPYGTGVLTVCCTELLQTVFGGTDFLRGYSSTG